MTQSALILGASGKFGHHAAQAFTAAGWHVTRFDRASGDLARAVRGVDVVVNGWNPPDYSTWARDMLPLHRHVIEAVSGTGATVVVPGNVYVFGADTPGPWSEHSPRAAQNPLGQLRIEMEADYRAADCRTILLRAGDFLDTRPSGNWFDKLMVAKLAQSKFTTPGDPDAPHAWAYLPDLARAAVGLAEKRADLPKFCEVPFPGYTLTGAQMADQIAALTGRDIRRSRLGWTPLLLGKYVMPSLRGLCEMRYLWDTPHALDASRFDALLPEFRATPVPAALRAAIAWTGVVSTSDQVDPDQTVPVGG